MVAEVARHIISDRQHTAGTLGGLSLLVAQLVDIGKEKKHHLRVTGGERTILGRSTGNFASWTEYNIII